MWALPARQVIVSALAPLLFHFLREPCVAGDAVFSKDGQRIYVTTRTDKYPALREIDLTNQDARSTSLRASCALPKRLRCFDQVLGVDQALFHPFSTGSATPV